MIKGDNIVICGGGAFGCDGAVKMAEEMGKIGEAVREGFYAASSL